MNSDAKAPIRDATAQSLLAVSRVTLSVVIPTYNERNNLRPLIRKITTALAGISWEIIIVDDDSPDGTAAIAKEIAQDEPRVRCLRRLNRRGLAGACLEGMLSSSADLVAIIDADMQHDERILPLMVSRLIEGADLVIGSRAADGGSSASGFGPGRAALSRFAIRCARLVLGTRVKDVMSGFFMLRRDLLDKIAPKLTTSGFKILADLLAHAPDSLRIEEVPYHFQARTAGVSKFDAKVGLDFAALLINKATHGLVPFRFVFFAFVGAFGVIIHMVILEGLMTHSGLSFRTDQAVATIIAMSSNFLINNEITYHDSRLRGINLCLGLMLFYLVCSIGALANISVASWIYQHDIAWWIAAIVGVAAGSISNFALSTAYVWPLLRRPREARRAQAMAPAWQPHPLTDDRSAVV